MSSSRRPTAALLDAVDEALGAQLIVEREKGRYDFTHALIRHTLYDELSTPRRLLLHRQIGEALERLYAADIEPHLAELAHHFYEAAPGGDLGKTIGYARRAGDQAMAVFAWEEALLLYRRALQAMDMQPKLDEVQRTELLMLVAGTERYGGDLLAATASGLEAVSLARRLDDPALFVRAVVAHDRASTFIGIIGDSPLGTTEELLDEALRLVPADDEQARAVLMAGKARVISGASVVGDVSRAMAADAVALARRVGDIKTLMDVIASCAMRFELDERRPRRPTAPR